jgi:hypothetical protein
MKSHDGNEYFHIAAAVYDQAVKDLGARDHFKHYKDNTDAVSGDTVEVLPLEKIADTKRSS